MSLGLNARCIRPGSVDLTCPPLEARDVPATIDLTAQASQAVVGEALLQQTVLSAAGSGNINAFVRIGNNTDVVQGYNTSARPLEFDEKTDAQDTRDLLLSEVP